MSDFDIDGTAPIDFFSEETKSTTQQDAAISVAEFVQKLQFALDSLSEKIKGEIIEIKVSAKLVFFKLTDKDRVNKLECKMWRSNYENMGMNLKQGDEVIATGKPEFYGPFGQFSFTATTIEPVGLGALQKAYEELKLKLSQSGMMERKRQVPMFLEKVGLITSLSSGVVIQDFKNNLEQHNLTVHAVDSKVEGKEAVHSILRAVEFLQQKATKGEIEALIVIRGGGSLESLQAFNTESVVNALFNFPVPVITGIGHDVDVTLCQLVADVGVSTPTAVAGYLNSPWQKALLFTDDAKRRVFSQVELELGKAKHLISTVEANIKANSKICINNVNNLLVSSMQKIKTNFKQALVFAKTQVDMGQNKTEQNNPNRQLKKGYSLLFNAKTGNLISSIKGIEVKNTKLKTIVFDGQIESTVDLIDKLR